MDRALRLGLCLFLTVAVFGTSGCESLHKKFVRKKKNDDTEVQNGAIYDPVDYPAVVKTSSQIYAQHYALWKVWYGDLMTNVDEGVNDKKTRSTLTQMQEQLAAMRELLNADLQAKVDGYSKELEQLTAEFQKPAELRNKTALSAQVRSLGRRFKSDLAVDKVQDHLASK